MTTHTISERDRAIDRAIKSEAERDRLRKINTDLLKALENITGIVLPERDNLQWREVVQLMKRIARAAIDDGRE